MIPAAGRQLLALLLAAGLSGACASSSAPEQSARTRDRAISAARFWQRYDEATSSRLRGDFAGAARAYEEAIALDPRHEDSLYYLGHCRRELGLPEGALEAFARLVELNEASARGHVALASLLSSPGGDLPPDLTSAERHLRRAHQINGEETGPMVRLGEILIVRGAAAEARAWLEAAVRTNPRSVEAAFLSGYLRWEAGDLEGARALYHKALLASRTEAPVKGVLSEGDRRPTAASPGSPAVPAPLKSPLGETLFGPFCSRLPQARAEQRQIPRSELDRAYGPVRSFARALARGSG